MNVEELRVVEVPLGPIVVVVLVSVALPGLSVIVALLVSLEVPPDPVVVEVELEVKAVFWGAPSIITPAAVVKPRACVAPESCGLVPKVGPITCPETATGCGF